MKDPIATINTTWNEARRCATRQDEIMNAVLGLAGEAGEVADLHKKMFFHTSRMNNLGAALDELTLELGDVFYYWRKVCDLYGLSPDDIIAANEAKLRARYPERFQEDLHGV